MKKLSIKWKVTLWYTGILAVILGFMFAAMISMLNETELSVTEEEIHGAVTGFLENITFADDTYYLDGDTDFYYEGVSFCIYDETGTRIHGNLPADFPENTVLWANRTRNIKADGKGWMVYDYLCEYSSGKTLWIRGTTSISNIENFMRVTIIISVIAFPVLILLIGMVGYFMIKKTLKPVDEICNAADIISGGRDLSKRLPEKKLEAEVRHLTNSFNEMFERLQQSFENEKQFTSDVSHELRTPLAIMISRCEDLLSGDKLSEEHKKDIEIILHQSRKMSKLVSQLLFMTREEKTIDTNTFEDIDLGMLLQMVSEEMQIEADKKSIVINTNIEENLMVHGEQTLLMRMAMNLIDNAIAYGRKGGNVFVEAYTEKDRVIGKVSDDGIGIAEEHLQKIWNRFYRADKSRSSEGTGLGLSMVRWIIDIHGGTIGVESKIGEGTQFYFRLPKGGRRNEADEIMIEHIETVKNFV